MTLIRKFGIISSVLCMALAACIGVGYCNNHEQVLVMGAQRDFKDAAEGKLLVFDTLVTLDESGNMLPKLASSWNISPDGKEWVLSLRQDVKYHDGTAFNGRTAKFAIERAMINAIWAKYVDDIQVVDDYTLKVFFNTYYYPFLRDMASGWRSENFVSPTAVEPPWDPKGKIVRYIGTGPFKLVDYKKDREATLARNNDYWGRMPKLTKILWKHTPDPYAQILALKAGELDIIGAPEHHSSVPFMKLAELEADSDFVVSTHSYGRFQVLDFNSHRPPFDDVRVRRALNCAIDRETMVRSLFGDITNPTYLITDPKFIWGPANIKEGYKYDIRKAKKLLAEAGWIDTDGNRILDKDGKNFEIELLVPTGEANADMVALVIQAQLKDMGITLNIKTLPNAWDKRKTGEYDLFLSHSGCLPSIPGGIGIGGKYHAKGGWPYAYHSDKLDALIQAAFTTTDKIRRRAKIDEIWPLLHDANPCIPLYDITKAVVMSKKVQGFKHGPTMFDMDLSEVVINQ
jgi:peptide/nickel transport system substrate-binding protein